MNNTRLNEIAIDLSDTQLMGQIEDALNLLCHNEEFELQHNQGLKTEIYQGTSGVEINYLVMGYIKHGPFRGDTKRAAIINAWISLMLKLDEQAVAINDTVRKSRNRIQMAEALRDMMFEHFGHAFERRKSG